MRLEYKTVWAKEADLEDTLNFWGAAGWRLVNIQPQRTNGYHQVIIERKKDA